MLSYHMTKTYYKIAIPFYKLRNKWLLMRSNQYQELKQIRKDIKKLNNHEEKEIKEYMQYIGERKTKAKKIIKETNKAIHDVAILLGQELYGEKKK